MPTFRDSYGQLVLPGDRLRSPDGDLLEVTPRADNVRLATLAGIEVAVDPDNYVPQCERVSHDEILYTTPNTPEYHVYYRTLGQSETPHGPGFSQEELREADALEMRRSRDKTWKEWRLLDKSREVIERRRVCLPSSDVVSV